MVEWVKNEKKMGFGEKMKEIKIENWFLNIFSIIQRNPIEWNIVGRLNYSEQKVKC